MERKVNPLSLNHLRWVRIALKTVGGWPDHAIDGRPHKVQCFTLFVAIECAVIIVGEILFIKNHFQVVSFFILGDVYISMALSLVVLVIASVPFFERYGIIMREFLCHFHLIHFKFKGGYSEIIFEKINKISHYFTSFTVIFTMMAAICFNIPPIYNSYTRGAFKKNRSENITLQFSVYFELPGFKQEKHFIVAIILNFWLCYVCGFIICIMDLLLCLMVFQIIGHIQVLRHSLRNFPKPQIQTNLQEVSTGEKNEPRILIEVMQPFSSEENKCIENKIKECVDRHLFIVSFAEDMSQFFGPLLAVNYFYHLFGLSLLLVECMQGEEGAYTRYGPLTLITIGQLTLLSITFEIVASKSEKLNQ
uniref:Odorant receptor n=1 Tax=Conogethes pinicolalis TaxID=1178461 RepID=A0A5B9GCI1_9NEOP|nr:odorant receptor 7 [Conogethes pinicolalis]